MHQAPVEANPPKFFNAKTQGRKVTREIQTLIALPTKLFLAPWRLCVLALKNFPIEVAFRHDQSRKHQLEFSA
jgi:hypothetical protein